MLEASAAFQPQVSSIQRAITMTPRMLTLRDCRNGYGVAPPGANPNTNFPVRLELPDGAFALLIPRTT
jgi:hypothetical protein